MSGKLDVSRGVEPSGSGAPTWWLVFTRELAELWISGRALTLLLIYCVLLGIMSYVLASNSELSLIPPNEMVYETVKAAIAVGVFISLIIGADSISGERERGTLESLLLTPTSRRQIIIGKFLAAVSPWPAAMLITIPYLVVLAQGDEILIPAILWGAALGSALAPAFTGVGMFVSFWCSANKNSLFVSLGIYVLILLPTQLPGRAQTGVAGQFLQWINPIAAANHFLSKHLVNHRTLAEFWPWLTAPVAFALVVFGLLFLYAGPGLRLEPGRASLFRRFGARAAAGASLIGLLALPWGMTRARADQAEASGPVASPAQALEISIDLSHKQVKASDKVLYSTTVKNNGTAASPPLMVAMNIINLDAKGDIVDPEDWSPQRTQYLEPLAPGASATQSWQVNAILDGDYMVYMVLIPAPGGPEATSQPVASSGIHLIVTPFTRLNPSGVLPYAIGGPLLLAFGIYIVYRRRRQAVDMGAAS
jgi:ABC-2 type transport system permease protein